MIKTSQTGWECEAFPLDPTLGSLPPDLASFFWSQRELLIVEVKQALDKTAGSEYESMLSSMFLHLYAVLILRFNNANESRKKRRIEDELVLKQWLAENVDDPYPDLQTKAKLAEASGLTHDQLDNWFNNNRAKVKSKLSNRENKQRREDLAPAADEANEEEEEEEVAEARAKATEGREAVEDKKKEHEAEENDDETEEEEKEDDDETEEEEKEDDDETEEEEKEDDDETEEEQTTEEKEAPGKNKKVRRDVLERWLKENFDDPYANAQTKEMLAEASGLTYYQVGIWLMNRRARLKKKRNALSPLNGTGKTTGKKRLVRGEMDALLQKWLDENVNDPYPDPQTKTRLAEASGLKNSQVENWFKRSRALLVFDPRSV